MWGFLRPSAQRRAVERGPEFDVPERRALEGLHHLTRRVAFLNQADVGVGDERVARPTPLRIQRLNARSTASGARSIESGPSPRTFGHNAPLSRAMLSLRNASVARTRGTARASRW